MKLNNKGWSLNTLLICMAIILSFLLISVLYVYKLSNEFTSNLTGVNNSTNYSNNNSSEISDSINNNNNTLDTKESNSSNNDSSQLDNNQTDNSSTTNAKDKYYMTKESQLQAGTIRYLKENAITIADDETIIINANDIINKKYIQAIKDDRTNNACDGYSVASFQDNDYNVKSYIACDSYSTEGYGVEE